MHHSVAARSWAQPKHAPAYSDNRVAGDMMFPSSRATSKTGAAALDQVFDAPLAYCPPISRRPSASRWSEASISAAPAPVRKVRPVAEEERGVDVARVAAPDARVGAARVLVYYLLPAIRSFYSH